MGEAALDPGSFGHRLNRLRVAAGLTQEALAERSGLSVDAISALENGRRRRPRAATVRLLADALGLRADQRQDLAALARAQGRAQPPPDLPPPLPPSPGDAPDPALRFVGREAELAGLRRMLRERGRVAVHGLGGVGKTQLVLRYARLHGADYPDGVYWLRADRESTVMGDLAGLAERLRLPEREAARQERQVDAVLDWLRGHDGWLLVLDNAESDAMRWLPADLPGQLVATSRTPMWAARLALEPLDLGVATRFLLEYTHQADVAGARAVAETLGGLPLALEQAGAYLEASARDLASYARLLQTRLLELMDEGLPDSYPNSLATTWRLTFERLDDERPAAASLLRLCAFLAADDISIGVLARGAAELPGELRAAVADEVELDRTVAAARRYSLLERRADGLSLHRLVQAMVREALPAERRAAWLGAAVRVLRASFPDQPQEQPAQWALCARLLPHVQAVGQLAGDGAPEPGALSWLLDRGGMYLDGRADFATARPLLEHALAIRERVLGPDHPDTAESLDNLAGLYTHTGDLGAARPLYDRALAIRERVQGPEHPETATSLNNLAVLLHRQGELAAARALYERALAIDERTLGPDHAHTAKDLNNLARLLRGQREPAAARPLLERALAISQRTVGPEHPLTATSLHNLAQLLRDQGELDAARPLFERALAIYERVLGGNHPHTGVALTNLSVLLREQGELTTAGRLAERAVAIEERVLGRDHPDVVHRRRVLEEIRADLRRP
ncbi:MAG TPA: tetratricopeptide repeat protein [Candidatus Dormibacteraeota bacterium]|nr:tetratricopeptide repeat protein [Candidatus Dormibacteraeota bacterium]